MVEDKIYGYEIIGNTEAVDTIRKKIDVHGIIIGIDNNTSRKKLKEKIKEISSSLKFISAVHPSAILANAIVIPKAQLLWPVLL